jgi:hypothetical protein
MNQIGHFYDAAVDAQLWQGMAGRIASAFDSTSTVVKFHGDAGDVELLETTDNMIVAEFRREWAEDWHRRDLWVHRTVAHGMDRIVTADMLVTPEEQRNSGFYREFLTTFDIHHLVGAAFTLSEGAVGVLGSPAEGAAAYDAGDRHRTALLLPHLARAVRVGRHLTNAGLAQPLPSMRSTGSIQACSCSIAAGGSFTRMRQRRNACGKAPTSAFCRGGSICAIAGFRIASCWRCVMPSRSPAGLFWVARRSALAIEREGRLPHSSRSRRCGPAGREGSIRGRWRLSSFAIRSGLRFISTGCGSCLALRPRKP